MLLYFHCRFIRGEMGGQSFTLHDRHTPQSARAAGIPVVETPPTQRRRTPHPPAGTGIRESSPCPPPGNGIRETSPRPPTGASVRESSPRPGSSDGSDQELRKIHADHRDKEIKDRGDPIRDSFFLNSGGGSVDGDAVPDSIQRRPASLNVPKPIQMPAAPHSQGKESPKTSFAQLRQQQLDQKQSHRQQQENGEVGGTAVFAAQQHHRAKPNLSPKVAKKTTFGAMPNQTTWQESAQKSTRLPGTEGGDGDTVQVSADLHSITGRD